MAVLSEAERAAIVQCYHNDLSHEEAAYVLDCPVGTVKTHVLRGKQKLKLRARRVGTPTTGRRPHEPIRRSHSRRPPPTDDWLDAALAADGARAPRRRTSTTTASPRA